MLSRDPCGHSRDMADGTDPVKVFLCDRSTLVRGRIAAMLEAAAMRIVGQSATPADSIAGIQARQPDVVVLEVQLDGGSGLQVLRAVRETAPGIAFIVFSNNSGPAYRQHYLRAGAVRLLDKSSEFDQLARSVANASCPVPHTSQSTCQE